MIVLDDDDFERLVDDYEAAGTVTSERTRHPLLRERFEASPPKRMRQDGAAARFTRNSNFLVGAEVPRARCLMWTPWGNVVADRPLLSEGSSGSPAEQRPTNLFESTQVRFSVITVATTNRKRCGSCFPG